MRNSFYQLSETFGNVENAEVIWIWKDGDISYYLHIQLFSRKMTLYLSIHWLHLGVTHNISLLREDIKKKKTADLVKTALLGGRGSEKLLNFHHLQMMKNMEGGGGLRVTFHYFIEPNYDWFRRRNCQYILIYIEYLLYQA